MASGRRRRLRTTRSRARPRSTSPPHRRRIRSTTSPTGMRISRRGSARGSSSSRGCCRSAPRPVVCRRGRGAGVGLHRRVRRGARRGRRPAGRRPRAVGHDPHRLGGRGGNGRRAGMGRVTQPRSGANARGGPSNAGGLFCDWVGRMVGPVPSGAASPQPGRVPVGRRTRGASARRSTTPTSARSSTGSTSRTMARRCGAPRSKRRGSSSGARSTRDARRARLRTTEDCGDGWRDPSRRLAPSSGRCHGTPGGLRRGARRSRARVGVARADGGGSRGAHGDARGAAVGTCRSNGGTESRLAGAGGRTLRAIPSFVGCAHGTDGNTRPHPGRRRSRRRSEPSRGWHRTRQSSSARSRRCREWRARAVAACEGRGREIPEVVPGATTTTTSPRRLPSITRRRSPQSEEGRRCPRATNRGFSRRARRRPPLCGGAPSRTIRRATDESRSERCGHRADARSTRPAPIDGSPNRAGVAHSQARTALGTQEAHAHTYTSVTRSSHHTHSSEARVTPPRARRPAPRGAMGRGG